VRIKAVVTSRNIHKSTEHEYDRREREGEGMCEDRERQLPISTIVPVSSNRCAERTSQRTPYVVANCREIDEGGYRSVITVCPGHP